jgi:DNA-binding CsgD family transcriptional regulator
MDGADAVAAGLLERGDELGTLSRLLESAAAGSGGLVLVEGPAGIGKTSLLRRCAEHAAGMGMAVLQVRGDDVAMGSSLAAVRELFWSPVRADGSILRDGAARLAAPVFKGELEAGDQGDRVAPVLHGLYWLVANLCDRSPLVLLIDDAHWLDVASARFVTYLARRADSLPVLLVLAIRPGESPGAVRTAAAWADTAARVLPLRPLSELASGELVRARLGPGADEELCRSCHEATGGNPFYLRQLSAVLGAERGRPTAELARRVGSLDVPGVGRSVLVRLSRLGADCEDMARALAVLAPGSPLRVAAALAGLDRDRAQAAADALREVGLLAAEPALSFAHAIVREAVSAQVAPSRRAALHGEAARLLAAEGAPADRVASHLLSAEPYGEPWVVDALRAAAREALTRGAPEAAVSYLRRALAEPPPPAARPEVLLDLGRAEALLPVAGDFDALREALDLAEDPQQRAEIALELAWALALVTRNAEIPGLLEPVLERAEGLDPVLLERVEALLIGAGVEAFAATRRVLSRVGGHVERAKRGEVRDPVMLAALALAGGVGGLPAADVTTVARLALAHSSLLEQGLAHSGATAGLCWADELADAALAQEVAIAEAQRRGSAPMFMAMSCWRGETAARAGELAEAEDHLWRAYELGGELGAGHFSEMFLIGVLLERGRLDECQKLAEALELDEQRLALWQGVIVLAQRGRARVALGELGPGVSDMLAADRRMAAAGCHLSVLVDWAPTATLALARLGRDDEARRLADRELADAVAFGAPRRHGLALSACGLLDQGEDGLARLRHAAAILEHSPARLAQARALVNLGVGLRAQGAREQAREPLLEGLDIAHRCGAVALAEQARAELVASGARPRRGAVSGPEALTPAELRTARMAGEGMSNRAIAEALFVSSKTVETHLSHAYAKLAIARRDELAGALRGP